MRTYRSYTSRLHIRACTCSLTLSLRTNEPNKRTNANAMNLRSTAALRSNQNSIVIIIKSLRFVSSPRQFPQETSNVHVFSALGKTSTSTKWNTRHALVAFLRLLSIRLGYNTRCNLDLSLRRKLEGGGGQGEACADKAVHAFAFRQVLR
jgi:hypothetical protein